MRLLALAALAASLAAHAQTVPARGDAATFDVAAWNVEHFGNTRGGFGPSDDARQQANVLAVMEQADIDLWALQEIGDADAFQDLLNGLADDGYQGVLGPPTPGSFQLRLAFVYDASVVTVLGLNEVLPGTNFGGRDPYELQARVSVGGTSRTIRVIDIHAKAGTGADDYDKRAAGAVELKAYVDARIARGESVIVLGDLNDFLTRSTRSGQPSPYAAFLADDDYVAATLPVEQAGQPTLCGNSSCTSGSTRDHLLFTADLSAQYVEGSGDRYGELIGAVSGYTFSTSDHLPVLARFSFLSTASEPAPGPLALAVGPNPLGDRATLRFHLAEPARVEVDVTDALGRRVWSASEASGAGGQSLALPSAAWAPGVYVVRLRAGDVTASRVVVRGR